VEWCFTGNKYITSFSFTCNKYTTSFSFTGKKYINNFSFTGKKYITSFSFTGNKYNISFSFTVTETANVAGARHCGTVAASHPTITKASPIPYESLRNRITTVVFWMQGYPLCHWHAEMLPFLFSIGNISTLTVPFLPVLEDLSVCVCVCIHICNEASSLFVYKYVDFCSGMNSMIIIASCILEVTTCILNVWQAIVYPKWRFSDFCQSI
jgi:hypothetical protein